MAAPIEATAACSDSKLLFKVRTRMLWSLFDWLHSPQNLFRSAWTLWVHSLTQLSTRSFCCRIFGPTPASLSHMPSIFSMR